MTELKRIITITPSVLNSYPEHDSDLSTYFDVLCRGSDDKVYSIRVIDGDMLTTLEQGTIKITRNGKAVVSRDESNTCDIILPEIKQEPCYIIKGDELKDLMIVWHYPIFHQSKRMLDLEQTILSRKLNIEMKPVFPCSHVHEEKACRRCPEFLKCEICESVKHQTLKEVGFSTGNDNANKDEQMK